MCIRDRSRLEKIGLGPFCLELHSNKATKRHVLTQLEEALKVAHILPPEGFQAQADKIFEMRKQLIDYMNALHDKDPQDKLSLYEYILHYESIDCLLYTSYPQHLSHKMRTAIRK